MESISIFEIIKVGIGPSSSHTMGPWLAAELFLEKVQTQTPLGEVSNIKVTCYGSLAKTGHGHGTDWALILGLSGENFQTINPAEIPEKIKLIKESNLIQLAGIKSLPFVPSKNIIFEKNITLDFHANGMLFEALLNNGSTISQKYYSLGGGFVSTEEHDPFIKPKINVPYPFEKAIDLTNHCAKTNLSIDALVYQNELSWRTPKEIDSLITKLWTEIKMSIYRGVNHSGILPGGLNVKRRAKEINLKLLENKTYNSLETWMEAIKAGDQTFNVINKWVTCFALAVNEENAAFGRIVTAPTNGSAGVIPAVLMYANCFCPNFSEKEITRFLLTAGTIGILFKKNATISAAMGGCQAEIGVSSSMAAAALTACLGGTPAQVLMAAEIAMEHHLGLTCDPVAGLVQIPCIERNSMGAIKAITASNIALESDPLAAKISLDDVIKTMWETAKNMDVRYKETSEGGLAAIPVNIIEC